MSQWSMPVSKGWKLRVNTGSSAGREIDLKIQRYIIGSGSGATIQIPDPSIAAQHVELNVQADCVIVSDLSGRTDGVLVNGKGQTNHRAAAGDEVKLGSFGFQLINQSLAQSSGPAKDNLLDTYADPVRKQLFSLAPHWQVAIVSGGLALLLLILMGVSGNPIMVPITVLAASVVVPASVMTWLIQKYDQSKISFRTFTLTFIFGGAIGFVFTMVTAMSVEMVLGGLILLPVFAGVFEEPAKLFATAWRWRHPVYDRPLDGLIIGAVSGFGFAVFETSGYFFSAMLEEGLSSSIQVVVLRSLCAPFTHGVWSALLCAAFWQCGRNLSTAYKDRRFLIALGISVGLHALWNLGASFGLFGLLLMIASGVMSFRLFQQRLADKGYMK